METELLGSIALEKLLELLDSKQFTKSAAEELVREAQMQRSRLLQEVCDLNVRLNNYRRNHETLMDAVTDITERNTSLRVKVIGLGGTV